MLEDIKKKYPVNSRGMTVIPCMTLTPENIKDWMIGLRVTIGLKEPGVATDQGTLEGFDDKNLWVTVGSKRKKYEYDPEDIQLCVYQFDKKILFSNETVIRKDSKEPIEEEDDEPIGKPPQKSEIKTKKQPPAKKETKPSNPKALFGM